MVRKDDDFRLIDEWQDAPQLWDAIAERDISRVDGIRRDASFSRRLLKSLARLQGTQSAISVIRADLGANEPNTFSENTIYEYIAALRKIFVLEDMPAWCPNLRCKTPIRTTDTRYFADPSIATAALGLGPDDLMNDLKSFGLFFETLCKLAREIDTKNMPEPSFRMIVVAQGDFAYERPSDGVIVCPIGALKP